MKDNTEVHFALTKFETAILDSLIDHDVNRDSSTDPMLDRSNNSFSVRSAIENGPVAELFSSEEMVEVSPQIDRTLRLFERAGLIEHSGDKHGWNWKECGYRLTETAHEMTTARRELSGIGAAA